MLPLTQFMALSHSARLLGWYVSPIPRRTAVAWSGQLDDHACAAGEAPCWTPWTPGPGSR